jgi:hypothetical protein
VIYHTLAVRSLGELVSFFERHVQHTYMVDPPSHFCNSCGTESARWALLNPAARAISPQYVRLSGEIADQSILDSLHEFYPAARAGHAYASTEATADCARSQAIWVAAVAAGLEVVTGVGLIIAPSLLARLLFGSEMNASGDLVYLLILIAAFIAIAF